LLEKFVEEGAMESLPGNEQTLRNYIHYLENNDIVDNAPENKRIYDHVFDTPPGEQMLIDFGQKAGNGVIIHFICLLLRYSRFLCVFAQDHKFNAEEACQSIYRACCKLGGRPAVLVIDQDAVFVSSETYGEVIETRVFGEFCREQEFKLWVCNKADPESKGPIENSVGFVKKNFFSARKITCIDDVWKSLPWKSIRMRFVSAARSRR
jgi:transposase